MKSISKISYDEKKFDLSAMKIFISIIAIFLSATMPNALTTTEKTNQNGHSANFQLLRFGGIGLPYDSPVTNTEEGQQTP